MRPFRRCRFRQEHGGIPPRIGVLVGIAAFGFVRIGCTRGIRTKSTQNIALWSGMTRPLLRFRRKIRKGKRLEIPRAVDNITRHHGRFNPFALLVRLLLILYRRKTEIQRLPREFLLVHVLPYVLFSSCPQAYSVG